MKNLIELDFLEQAECSFVNKEFKKIYLWNLKYWRPFHKKDWGAELFGQTIYFGLGKNNTLFVPKKEYLQEYSKERYKIEKIIHIVNPTQIIFYHKKSLYLIKNDEIQLKLIFKKDLASKILFKNKKEIKKMIEKETDLEYWVNLGPDFADSTNILGLKEDLNNYLYKSKFYTFFLINWLKLQIKFYKLINYGRFKNIEFFSIKY